MRVDVAFDTFEAYSVEVADAPEPLRQSREARHVYRFERCLEVALQPPGDLLDGGGGGDSKGGGGRAGASAVRAAAAEQSADSAEAFGAEALAQAEEPPAEAGGGGSDGPTAAAGLTEFSVALPLPLGLVLEVRQ